MYQIKDFNVLIDEKNFFDLPVKNQDEVYERTFRVNKKMTTQLVTHWILVISKNITD